MPFCRHLSFYRTLRCLSFTLLVLLLCGLPESALAQNPKRSQKITISKHATSDVCLYEIEGQADQDTFSIQPRGVVLFKALDGIETNVEIEADGSLAGTQGSNQATLRRGADMKVLVVRNATDTRRSSRHDVRIRCCLVKDEAGNCKWTPAEPVDWRVDLGSLIPYAPDSLFPLSGPNPSPRESGPVGTGGPTMEVEDDG